jgi:hypothetical protein
LPEDCADPSGPVWGSEAAANLVKRYGFGVKIVAPTIWSTRNGNIRPDYLPRPLLRIVRGKPFIEELQAGYARDYRYLLRRFGRLLEAEGIAPSALTPDLAVELGRRLPTTPKSQIKIPNLARLFVAHLIEIGVATRPPLTPAQAECAELMSNFETNLLRQRGVSPRSVYHVLRFADRLLDHRFGDHMLDLPALNAGMSWHS